jgi:hypothetical protein
MGHSGGGSHALACAALLPERVLSVVVVAGMAPFGAEGLDWFEGFGPAGVAELRAAAAGRAALEKHLAESDEEPEFTPEDEAALAGEWSWFIEVVHRALAGGMGGSSTTISPASGRGASTLPTSPLQPFSCTDAGIARAPAATQAAASRASSSTEMGVAACSAFVRSPFSAACSSTLVTLSGRTRRPSCGGPVSHVCAAVIVRGEGSRHF